MGLEEAVHLLGDDRGGRYSNPRTCPWLRGCRGTGCAAHTPQIVEVVKEVPVEVEKVVVKEVVKEVPIEKEVVKEVEVEKVVIKEVQVEVAKEGRPHHTHGYDRRRGAEYRDSKRMAHLRAQLADARYDAGTGGVAAWGHRLQGHPHLPSVVGGVLGHGPGSRVHGLQLA